MRRRYGSHMQRSWGFLMPAHKKGKYKIVHNHSSCLKTKIKITENKPDTKDCKVYTRVYCVWVIKPISITCEMLLNPALLSGRSVWTSIHTHIESGSLQYPDLDTQSTSSWSQSLSSRLLVGISHPHCEADASPGTALWRCWGSFSEYIIGVSPPAILPLCSLFLWRQAF